MAQSRIDMGSVVLRVVETFLWFDEEMLHVYVRRGRLGASQATLRQRSCIVHVLVVQFTSLFRSVEVIVQF